MTQDPRQAKHRQEVIFKDRLIEGRCYIVNNSAKVKIVTLGKLYIDVLFIRKVGEEYPDKLTYNNYFKLIE